jgi:serine protease Do
MTERIIATGIGGFAARRRRALAAVVWISVIGALVASATVAPPGISRWLGLSVEAQTSRPTTGLPDFPDMVERVKPAVVGIRAQTEAEGTVGGPSTGRERSPSDRFFGGPKDRQDTPQGQTPQRPRRAMAQGSGFFISADGYIVTANHVIENAKSIEIKTDDQKTYAAKLIGADSASDLALLKVDAEQEFPFVRLAERSPRIGDWVLAVGNPFGLGGTVTAGIVSARGRDLKTGAYNDFIQIDAPVNQGNSGGPTFNIQGEVIGVNNAIFSPTGGSIGIGFAIPADTVKSVVAQLKSNGSVTRGWIGIRIQAVTEDIAQRFGAREARGALVVEPQADSPAAKAGLAGGDIITSLNGEPVKDDRDLMKTIADLPPGTPVTLGILRKGQELTITLTLGTLPRQRSEAPPAGHTTPAARTDTASLGLSLLPSGMPSGDQGVVITDVDGVAAERGLEPGDLILDVSGRTARTPADVQHGLDEARARGKPVAILRVKSGEDSHFVALPVE